MKVFTIQGDAALGVGERDPLEPEPYIKVTIPVMTAPPPFEYLHESE
jgi:hypothetical protein